MYQQIASNKRKSLALLVGFLLLYGALGYVLSLYFGTAALVIAVGIAIFMLVINLYMADDLVALVTGARRVERKEEAPELWRMVENLAITAGLPMPRVYVVPDDSPNAFAAGRTPKQAIVAVTTGLLERLDEEELEGVLAHEMSHIRNYDVRLMTWAAVLAGSIAMLAWIFTRALWFGGGDRDRGGGANIIVLVVVLVSLILAPIAAVLIQVAISAETKPSRALGNPAVAHMMIVAPLGARGTTSKLFATHPPPEDRVARLEQMAGGVEHRHESLTEGRAMPRAEEPRELPPEEPMATTGL